MPPKPPPLTRMQCLANLKRLTMAQVAYAADHEGGLPTAYNWPHWVRPYLPDYRWLTCPEDKRSDRDKELGSYAFNVDCDGSRGVSAGNAAALVLMFDGTFHYGRADLAAFRHEGGLNVGYADGHCAWRSRNDFLSARLTPDPQDINVRRPPGSLPAGPLPPAPPESIPLDQPQQGPPHDAHWGRVGARLTVDPCMVPVGQPVNVYSTGSYTLEPELNRLVYQAQAVVQERYFWLTQTDLELNKPPPGSAQRNREGRNLRYIFGEHYAANRDRFRDWHPFDQALWAGYTASVILPDGTVEWAEAIVRYLPQVQATPASTPGGAKP